MAIDMKKVDPSSLRYSVVIRPDVYEDGTIAYIAEVPELPGCKSHGSTPAEARVNVADAQKEYIEALIEQRLEIPLPSGAPSAVWIVQVPQTSAEGEKHRIREWPTVKGGFLVPTGS